MKLWLDLVQAYRKLALAKHPDRGGDPEEFARLSKAYEACGERRTVWADFFLGACQALPGGPVECQVASQLRQNWANFQADCGRGVHRGSSAAIDFAYMVWCSIHPRSCEAVVLILQYFFCQCLLRFFSIFLFQCAVASDKLQWQCGHFLKIVKASRSIP